MALHMNRPARIGEVSTMSLVRWLFVVGLALAACGCKSSGNISGYDGDSPAGSESDWF